jgi:AhpD family alkylhydroperoxidase
VIGHICAPAAVRRVKRTNHKENIMEAVTIEARMQSPVFVLPDALQALYALGKASQKAGLSSELIELVNLRASQINGCSVCVQMHSEALKKAGESDERIFSVSAWREAPYFTEAERAALALAEAETRLSDRPEAVSDEVWDEVARHYDETELAGLVVAIANINVWNRLNAATRQPAGLKW